MGKLDELRRMAAGNADESMGAGRPAAAPVHGAPPAGPRAVPARLQGVVRAANAAEIPVDRIAPDPGQPREDFDPEPLGRLAESLRTRGQLQPIRVRWDEGAGVYRIMMGERRWRAAQMAGLATLSCVIYEAPLAPAELLAVQVAENALREDLKPIEQARAYKALMDLNEWSARQVARELAIDHSNVVRSLKLLETPAAVQDLVEQGTLSPATAYEVSKLEDPGAQAEVAARVVAENLSRAETVEVVRQAAMRTPRAKQAGKGRAAIRARPRPTRTLKAAGCKVTVANRRGVDDALLIAALREALGQVEAAIEPGDQAAA